MMDAVRLLGAIFILAVGSVHAQSARVSAPDVRRPPACADGRTALVLSGGGAKGLAHVGLLRALDSLGVRPDLIVGSSMGAIVGSLYASGLDGRTIDSLARQVPLARLLNTFEPRAARELGRLQPLVTWEEGNRGIGIQTTAVREEMVNALTSEALLRGNLIARGDFDRLPIPFRAMATDLRDRRSISLRSGDLAEAVRASYAIPLLFRPVPINGRVLADGGLSANIPVAAARAEGATRVIVSDVSERVASDSADLEAVVGIADRLINFLFLQPLDSLGPDDLYLRTPLPRTPSLDFTPSAVIRIIEAGRVVADSALATAACLPYGVPRTAALPSRFGPVDPDADMVTRPLGIVEGGQLELQELRRNVAKFERDPRFRAVWLRPSPIGDSAVRFSPRIQPTPRRSGHLGLVYDSDLGGRAWIGVLNRNVMRTGATGSAVAYFGELQRELRVALRRPLSRADWAAGPMAMLRTSDEEVRQFDASGTLLRELDVREASAFLGLDAPLDHAWSVQAGLLGRWWNEPTRGDDDALGVAARLERFGAFVEPQLTADVQITSAYRRALLDVRWRAGLAGLRLFPRLRLVTGDSVPLQLTTPLGGLEEGFPGLRFGELRGDREAMLGMVIDRRLAGPLYLRLEGAVGRSANGGPLLADDAWIGGLRGGVGIETVLGPIRVEYGGTTSNRSAFFFRFARWIPQPD